MSRINKFIKVNKCINKFFIVFLISVIFISQTGITTALSKAQLEDFRNHIYYFNECGGGQPSSNAAAASGNDKVYLLGDSLLEGAYYETGYLKKDLKDKGWQATADASSGRGLRNPGIDKNNNRPGHEQSAFNALKTDENEWQDAGTIVLELGTNESNSNAAFKSDMGALIDSIQAKNKDANIYWVNLFSDVPQAKAYNAIIKQVAADKNLKGVIDTTSIRKSGVVHPNPPGYQKFSKIISDAIGEPAISSGGKVTGGVQFTTGMTIETDGSGPHHGDRWAQGQTSLQNGGSYLNADTTNFIALAPGWASAHGIKLGDVAAVQYKGKTAYAVYGDNYMGNQVHGEGSYHLAQALGIDPNPNSGGVGSGVHYFVYPGSHNQLGGTFDQNKIDRVGAQVSGGGAPNGSSASTDSSGDPSCCNSSSAVASAGSSDPGGSVALTGKDNEEKIFNYFLSRGLSPIASAGIDGNFAGESTWNPASSGGYLAQWQGSRATALGNFAKSQGKPITDLQLQLDFVWFGLTHQPGGDGDYRSLLKDLKAAKTVEEATTKFMEVYERPGIPHLDKRIAAAKATLNKYSNNAPGGATSSGGATACCPTGGQAAVADGSPSDWKKMYTGANKAKVADMSQGGRSLNHPKALIIHYTQGHQEGQALLDFFVGAGTGIQFNVGKDGQVYQYYPLNDMKNVGHVGPAMNSKSIGIEITGMDVTELLNNDKQFQSVASLAKFLMNYYHIPADAKGDMTGDGADTAQGMMGHDEAPRGEHNDPDAKYGQDISRTDSSKHPYMMKLRTSLGYDPTPGKAGGSTGASTTPDSSSASSSNPGCQGVDSTAGVKIDMDNLDKDSTHVACAPGTKEIRNDTGYRQGKAVPIKLCEVTNLPQSQGFGSHNGHASINSRASGAVYAMVAAAKQDGVNMSAVSTFRTMADQRSLCPCDGSSVAIPGYSNHQLGVAIDFGGSGELMDKGNPMWKWLSNNASKFDYKPYTREDWHWSPYGN